MNDIILVEMLELRIKVLKDRKNNLTLIDCLENEKWNDIVYKLNNQIEILENILKSAK